MDLVVARRRPWPTRAHVGLCRTALAHFGRWEASATERVSGARVRAGSTATATEALRVQSAARFGQALRGRDLG